MAQVNPSTALGESDSAEDQYAPYSEQDYAQALASGDGDDDEEYLAATNRFQDYAELPSFSDDEPGFVQGVNGDADLKPGDRKSVV